MNEKSWAFCTTHNIQWLFQPGQVEKCPSCRVSDPLAEQGLNTNHDPSKSRLQRRGQEVRSESMTERCQAKSEECGQCEFIAGHAGNHLAGYLSWSGDVPASERAVPPAMQRASSEAQFNVVGDELRKLNEKMDKLTYRQGLMEVAANERYTTVEALRVSQEIVRQKLEGLKEAYDEIASTHTQVYDIGEELRKLNVAFGESLGTVGEGIAHLMERQRLTETVIADTAARVQAIEASQQLIMQKLEGLASGVVQASHQAQINKLFERQDEHKKYILQALQGQEYYSKKAFDEILERFDGLAKRLMLDRIAAASSFTVRKEVLAKPKHPSLRPVSRKKRKR
jgi:hypothetical protein